MNSREKWNQKYQQRLTTSQPSQVNKRLINFSPYLKGGTALDIACGLGANSRYLAQLGYKVDAIDGSDVAIEYVKKQVEKENLSIQPILADLTEYENLKLNHQKYDLVHITYYLDRNLFPIIKSILKESGFLFIETYFLTSEIDQQHVSNKYKLKSQELLKEFIDWKILFYEEEEHEGRQTIFCQKGSC
ncbi:methyltransferase domain-containing protein [Mesobacillus maritimus]|uniref:class I SAM-dependent methyltransferase n=1 Tax=Mesobacillus maritimus TaxID=1643336 RepID=UPI0020419DF1|nr:methyltransferase domain-containing protein [Mesobacillus maritimus]MCM3585857.1 methyltransferase domain-containing protein [Mesobacillus maritimus]